MGAPLKRACRPLSFMGRAVCNHLTLSRRALAKALGTSQTGLAVATKRTVDSFLWRAAAARASGLIRRTGPLASAPTAVSAPCVSTALQAASQRSDLQRLLLSGERAMTAHTRHQIILGCSLAAQPSMRQVGLIMRRTLAHKEGLTSGCTARMEDTAAFWTYRQTCRQRDHIRVMQGSQGACSRCPMAKVPRHDHLNLGQRRCTCAACIYVQLFSQAL